MTGGIALFAVFAAPAQAAIKTPSDKFVRTANYYLRAGTDIRPEHYPTLASYDLVVFPAEAQVHNPTMFARLREMNPTIVILAYVPSKSWNWSWSDPLHAKLQKGIAPDWWLYDPQGNRVSIWPGTNVLSGVSGWNEYLPRFVRDEIWSTGYWDGVFYDEFSSNASWMNGGWIDIHRDGVKDDPGLLDVAWKRGMQNMLAKTREYLGANAVIVTNGDSTEELQAHVNGRMFESFPTPWEAGGTWSGVMANYLGLHAKVGYPAVFIINSNTGNTGNNADFRKMRYGLASTLLGDGFFSFDFGEQDHGQLWRYDEMDVRLGAPLAGAFNVQSPADRRTTPGVWRRDFQHGVVLLNSTNDARTVSFQDELEKLRGSQDPRTNDGSIVTSVTLPPSDGLVLLRRIEKLPNASFPNGSFVRLFDTAGTKQRNGFFAYEAAYGGAANVTYRDADRDGSEEKLVAERGTVTVYKEGGAVRSAFKPYGDAYTGDVKLAVGDLDGDGIDEIVTGAGPGGGPHVRIFSLDGRALHPGFFAYDPRFRGGVEVAVADLYGTGRSVIITGAGAGGGPHVRIFNRAGRLLHPGFFAYDYRFRGGVRVAAGDLDGDGKAEIVTGAGPGGGPHVRIFTNAGRPYGDPKGFFAADPVARNGVRVAVTDTDRDGRAEIAAFTTDVFQFAGF